MTHEPSTDTATDADAPLARRAAAGDAGAFEALYRRHAGLVFGICRRISANTARAEELTQDAFVRAWQRLGTWDGSGPFAGWLARLAFHVAIDDQRAAAGRTGKERPLDDAPPPAGPRGPERRLDLEQAIAALPQGARHVFVMFDVYGLAHEEIAGRLGISESTSKSQLHRARKLLQEALS